MRILKGVKKMKLGRFSYLLALLATLTACSTKTTTNETTMTTSTSESESVAKTDSTTKETTTAKSTNVSTTTVSSSEKNVSVALAGIFYTETGEEAQIRNLRQNEWEIFYPTSEGNVSGTFTINWQETDSGMQSDSMLKKSDGSGNFEISIRYRNEENIFITMGDGNVNHEMKLTKQAPQVDAQYEEILKGDLSSFAGQFSNDQFNQTIAESNFTLGGYRPEDYFNDQTTVFPAIVQNGYWNGITSHGSYEIRQSDLPKKVDNYYLVHVYGANAGANDGKITFYLVPPFVKGPDGIAAKEKRVFQVMADGSLYPLEYQKENWWQDYQHKE